MSREIIRGECSPVPDTTAGRDLITLAERGDLGGASFGFKVRSHGDIWNGNVRTLKDVDLHEISIISAKAAYEKTALEFALRYAAHRGDHMRRGRILALAETNRWV